MGFWMLIDRNDGAILDAVPINGPEGWRYRVPQRLAGEFPRDAVIGFSPNFPEQRRLYDFVDSILEIRIVSERVRRIVMELAPHDAEFLPVTLLDHQKDVVSRDYFIMNVVSVRDVIDLERSKIRMGHLDPEEISRVWQLTLKNDIPSEGPRLFRATHLSSHAMIDDTLHAALASAGLTGVFFLPANGWDGKPR